MSERKALLEIYNNILNGVRYGKDCDGENIRFPYFYNQLYKTVGNYIGYTHFGSSAVDITEKDLLWIITVIFDTTPSKFLAEYIPHTMSKYA